MAGEIKVHEHLEILNGGVPVAYFFVVLILRGLPMISTVLGKDKTISLRIRRPLTGVPSSPLIAESHEETSRN
jgi:hypothetical protein